MTLSHKLLQQLILAVVLAPAALAPVLAADPVAEFYKGKTVTIVVGYAAGGAYDLYARLLARQLGKHIPGNPNVIVQNMPGAGSMAAANHVFNVAPQDGTFMAATSAVLPFQPLLEVQAAKFDIAKFHWMPVPTGETNMVSVWHTVPIGTFLDARKRETLIGTSGPNSSPAFYGRIFNDVFKTRFKMIHGYTGVPQSFLAMERGEVEGHTSATWTSYKTSYAAWLAEKKIKLLLQYGRKPHPELPDVPFARNLPGLSEEDRLLLDMSMAPTFVGRPYMMGPGTPPERVAAIRKAMIDSFNDPALREEAEKGKLDLDPVAGEEVQAIIERAYSAPQPMIDRLRALYSAAESK